MKSQLTTLHSVSSGTTARPKHILIKSRCQDCEHYHKCPRMQGQNICYGKKEVLNNGETT